ncbi:uncharacterized protein LOC111436572 [Cucurbita moschata]|uniref:Uncharacterized protein LOC111436572 n=1 Tax=Cucurbita moschata TaxID=3662 RepID=A0A6J1EW08_CUCMO|nr:uncharacterized protein LOC111436572 [Cucurbita moschata]
MEVAKAEEIKEKEVTCDGKKKEKEDGNNDNAIEKQVAGETKAEEEKEKEAIVSGNAIEVAQGTKPIVEQQLVGLVEQVIKPVEEKPLARQVEQVIKTVDEKQLPIETKTEKKESGDNGGSFHPVKRIVSLISHFMAFPMQQHFAVAKRALRYLKGTINYDVFYKRGGVSDRIGFTDSDYASDIQDRKSTTGYVFMMSEGAMAWSSRKQPIVTLTTIEAEFVAAACACQAV